tara:strand:- start:1023 stop:1232 length:210 start_codon:yes stop_codon:yes gene_type:complete
MFTKEEKDVLIELIDKEIDRINREFKTMDSIGDSFYINEGLLFENMHVKKKLQVRLESIESAKNKVLEP